MSENVEAVVTTFRVKPVPDWVDVIDWLPLAVVQASQGLNYILSDTQENFTLPSISLYSHLVMRVDSPAGLSEAAAFSVSFDPRWETIDLHWVKIWRDNNVIHTVALDEFQVLRRERGIERRQYDGRYVADLALEDLRVGDIVERAYTIHGKNPGLPALIEAFYYQSWSSACALTRCRVLVPPGSDIVIRRINNPPMHILTRQEDMDCYEWRSRTEAGFQWEHGSPPGHIQLDGVEISDTKTWTDVADHFRAFYEIETELPESLRDEITKLNSPWADVPTQIMECVRLVQREIRYLSLTMGAGGLVPRPVAEIWSSRFGDCKDKSRLLVTILKSLGIQACPALVSFGYQAALAEKLPSYTAFDHCVVRITHDDQVYYFDATSLPLAGSLQTATPARFGYALPLIEGGVLEEMPHKEAKGVIEAFETWVFGAHPRDPATLTIKTIWRDWRADSCREALLQDGEGAVADSYFKFYDQRYKGITLIQPTRFEDDSVNNVMTIYEHYQVNRPMLLPDGGTGMAGFQWLPEEMLPDFDIPETNVRKSPLGLGVPRSKLRTSVFKFGWKMIVEDMPPQTIETPHWSYSNRWEAIDSHEFRVHERFTCQGGSLPASEAEAFFEALRRADAASGVGIRQKMLNGKISGAQESIWDKVKGMFG